MSAFVFACITALGAPSYKTRDAAEVVLTLIALQEQGVTELRLAIHSKDAEIASRALRIFAAYSYLPCDLDLASFLDPMKPEESLLWLLRKNDLTIGQGAEELYLGGGSELCPYYLESRIRSGLSRREAAKLIAEAQSRGFRYPQMEYVP